MLAIPTTIIFDPRHWTAKHHKQASWKVSVICETDGEIDLYYAWLLRKRFSLVLNQPLRKAHVTIVNDRILDKDAYKAAKLQYNRMQTTFSYDPEDVRTNGQHWWINVTNPDVADIRKACGFAPDPYFKLHFTIGYANDKHLVHSRYIHDSILAFGL